MTSLNLLQQIYARLIAKSPKFFQVIGWISAVCAFVTGLPGLLESFQITLPESLTVLQNQTIAIASVVSLVISKLTVDTPVATAQVLEAKIK